MFFPQETWSGITCIFIVQYRSDHWWNMNQMNCCSVCCWNIYRTLVSEISVAWDFRFVKYICFCCSIFFHFSLLFEWLFHMISFVMWNQLWAQSKHETRVFFPLNNECKKLSKHCAHWIQCSDWSFSNMSAQFVLDCFIVVLFPLFKILTWHQKKKKTLNATKQKRWTNLEC